MTERIELYKSDAISSKEEDLLGRGSFIDAVVNFIESQSTQVNKEGKKQFRNLGDPLTIGIYGKWGYGKTSVINCVKSELEKKHFFTAYYNPWMYNSEEDLIKHLFETIISSVNVEVRNSLSKTLGKYFVHFLKGFKIDARFGIPNVFQIGVAQDAKPVAEVIEKDLFKEETVYNVKDQINKVLQSLSNPIVIFIDDIDRLSKNEVYTLFKTVRLIADFKNIIYVLSFDDEMVAKSIKENFADGQDEDGYGYLEKIIDMPLRIPSIDSSNLKNYLSNLLDIKWHSKSKVFKKQFDIITNYLLETPRDCIRTANSIKFVYSNFGLTIDFDDLILIEAIRVKSSHLFGYIERYYKDVVINNATTYYQNKYNSPEKIANHFNVSGIGNQVTEIWKSFFITLLRVDIIYSLDILTSDEVGEIKYQDAISFSNLSPLINERNSKIYNVKLLNAYMNFISYINF